jgi:hypothetical protein
MRLRIALAVPVLVLLACTSGGSEGAASVTPTSADTPQGTSKPAPQATTGYANWATYHGNRARTGYAATMPTATGPLRVLSKRTLDGPVYASPIVIGGRVVVATENDTVYAYQSGTLQWKRHLGTPSPSSEHPCPGNINPRGITGTPVYYQGLVYLVAEYANPPRHDLVALRLSTGSVAWHRNIDYAAVGVDPAAMQQRGALTVAGGRVWVTFGGISGDCGDYKGRVIGIRLDGSGVHVKYTVPTTREAGIWTPPGPSVDSAGYLYVAVGNGESAFGDPYDKSDSVLKLNNAAQLLSYFAPTTWREDNEADLDLGSQGPALVNGKWVFADGKRGVAYVLAKNHLGGIGGQVSSRAVCSSYGGTAVRGSRVYVPCTDGVRAVQIGPNGGIGLAWRASSAIAGSPVIGGRRVWALDQNGGVLHALNPDTGNSVAHISVGATSRFATPAIYGRNVYVGTLTGLTIVRTS